MHRVRSSPRDVHGADLAGRVRRTVRIVEVDRPALVLGSTQPIEDVDLGRAEREGIDVVRRRSGGGGVLLDPGDVVWVDVEIPRDDELWSDDVGRAASWLGRVWVRAIAAAVGSTAVVHDGPMQSGPLAPVVCFAGLAPGEVTIDGAKVVGISQRRTRAGARFQCAVPRRWDVERHAALLGPGIARSGSSIGTVRVATIADAEALLGSFLADLP